jgi:hypothetical protein
LFLSGRDDREVILGSARKEKQPGPSRPAKDSI